MKQLELNHWADKGKEWKRSPSKNFCVINVQKSLSLEEKRKAHKVDTPRHFSHARPDAYYNNNFLNKPEGLQVIPPSHANW